MKTLISISLVIIVTFISNASDNNNPHLFQNNFKGDKNSCTICHITRNQKTTEALPVWNTNINSKNFELGTESNEVKALDSQLEITKLCLSCHDGSSTNNVHSFGASNENRTQFNYKKPELQHPVNIEYTAQTSAKNNNLFNPNTTPSGLGGTIAEDLLSNGKLECTSCHVAHFELNDQDNKTLVKSNTGSNLCLTCHNL